MEKPRAHIVIKIIEYSPHAVVSKTIIKRATGSVIVSSFDEGEGLAEECFAFDNYIQIIEGSAEIIIDGGKYKLELGEGIVIPAHSTHSFNAKKQFKMISTIIKSGYEDIPLS